MPKAYRVSLGFTRLLDGDLSGFSANVVASLTSNPGYTTPLIPLTEITIAQTAFDNAVAAALDGGKLAIAQRDAAREALVSLLRQEGAYVQSIAGEDLPLLVSSGFQPVNTNRTQIPLAKPVIDRIDNEQSTQLALRLKPVDTARAYEVRMSYGTSGWQATGVFTQARRIVLDQLTPGTTYTVQARAIGGSTGYSDWSDPVSHMSL